MDSICEMKEELEKSLYREMQENEANRSKIKILQEALEGRISSELPRLHQYI